MRELFFIKSNQVRTPPDGLSSDRSVRWVDIRELCGRLFDAAPTTEEVQRLSRAKEEMDNEKLSELERMLLAQVNEHLSSYSQIQPKRHSD